MGKFLKKKLSQLTKSDWKTAREAAGFEATLFGGPAVGSKVEAFQKAIAKVDLKNIDSETDIKAIKSAIKATKELEAALRAYAEKAKKEAGKGKNKDGDEFAEECLEYANKAKKRLDKLQPQLAKLVKIWDELTDGEAKRKAVKQIGADFGVAFDF